MDAEFVLESLSLYLSHCLLASLVLSYLKLLVCSCCKVTSLFGRVEALQFDFFLYKQD
eukprot:Gb_22045 [translate_table: standard]